jgi:hypothetical protein
MDSFWLLALLELGFAAARVCGFLPAVAQRVDREEDGHGESRSPLDDQRYRGYVLAVNLDEQPGRTPNRSHPVPTTVVHGGLDVRRLDLVSELMSPEGSSPSMLK